jgi:hypothetical protein
MLEMPGASERPAFPIIGAMRPICSRNGQLGGASSSAPLALLRKLDECSARAAAPTFCIRKKCSTRTAVRVGFSNAFCLGKMHIANAFLILDE